MVLLEPGVVGRGVRLLHGVLRAERRQLRIFALLGAVSCEGSARLTYGLKLQPGGGCMAVISAEQ